MTTPGRARVLVVDDDEIDAMRAERILEALGCEVHVEDTPMKLAATVRTFRPDLVLMDINLPELSGDHAARVLPMLSQAMKIPNIPVVLWSGEPLHILAELSALINAAGYVSKDASAEEIGHQVLMALSFQHRTLSAAG